MPENSQTQYDPRVRLNVTSDFKQATIEMPNGTELQVGNVVAETNPLTGGDRFLINGDMVSGEWVTTPAIFKLLMNGTGAVTLDARDANGVVTTGVFAKTLSGAVNEVGFPYSGDAAMAVRANFPQTANVKVI